MRVCFTNLGCKLNQAEVERLARGFVAAGHEVVGSLAEADLHVVNSCTVTHVAARSSRRAATRAGRLGDPALRVKTVLTGCYATASEAEAARLPGVDLVVANRDKDRLVELVGRAFPAALPSPAAPCATLDLAGLGRTRALIKVEDGCDMRCAFCIIPSTRGRQASRPLPEVVEEARALAAAGVREIVVTGVQISAYRWEGRGLADLVAALLAALPAGEGAPRLRLTSIAPWDFDERLLGLWQDPRLCRHVHLSLQSGSTAVLRRMRRPYDAERYAALVARLRAAVPGVAVTTDVIAGFPGETAAELDESLAFVEAMAFAKVHAFPFSPRPGTEAAALPDQVPPAAVRARMERLLAVAERAERRFWQSRVGRRVTVLWERPKDGLDGIGHGLTGDYVRVLSRGGAGLAGRFAEADLVAVGDGGVLGEVVRGDVSSSKPSVP